MKKLGFALVLATVTAALAAPAFAATWQREANGQFWYQLDNGAYYQNGDYVINGTKYRFDQFGYMKTGWQQMDGFWVYFEPTDGTRASGWKQVDGKWYYFEPGNGAMHVGWLDIGKNRYYMDESGVMQTGFFFTNGGTVGYYAGADGAIYRKGQIPDGQQCNVIVRKGSITDINTGTITYFDENGVISFSDQQTRLVQEAGGEDSHIRNFMDTAHENQQKEMEEDAIRDFANEKQEELEANFVKRVYGRKGSTYTQRLAEWETKARKELQPVKDYMDVEGFISSVKNGSYSVNDEGEYSRYGGSSSTTYEEEEEEEEEDVDYDE